MVEYPKRTQTVCPRQSVFVYNYDYIYWICYGDAFTDAYTYYNLYSEELYSPTVWERLESRLALLGYK